MCLITCSASLRQSFDAGASFCFVLDTDRPEGHRMQLSTIRALQPYEDIWLVDHAWSFRNEEEARAGLRQSEALRQRLLDLLEIRYIITAIRTIEPRACTTV